MNPVFAQLQVLFAARSPRERWILVIASCVLALWAIDAMIATPLQDKISRSAAEIGEAEAGTLRAAHLAQRILELRNELSLVEKQIQPGANTNLLALIETLAGQAGIKGQLESIKPRQASGNAQYPETRVEVSLKGATIEQTVKLLHAIENGPLHLLVRSLRVRVQSVITRKLNVSFFVSSFERSAA